jgi:PIN domain nuclease of toxin-antitoxin system
VSTANRLLLDTHVFLWWRGEPSRLTAEVRSSIATADIVFVSVASAWEAAIKVSLGRLDLPATVEAGVLASGFEKLLITFSHTEQVARLPHHHRDPFDRMLVAQAQSEGLTLVTHDRLLEPYDVEILWA